MLYYLLEDHHGDEFVMAFSRIISMLTGLRSLTENYFRQFKSICKDTLIKREMPELLGFLFDEWFGTFVHFSLVYLLYACWEWIHVSQQRVSMLITNKQKLQFVVKLFPLLFLLWQYTRKYTFKIIAIFLNHFYSHEIWNT